MDREGSKTLCFVLAFLLAISGAALAQNVVDIKNCEESGLHCPKDGEESYKKYCCLDSDGQVALYSCCNPYLGLIIGVSVGIPIIILIIVAVVVAYCVCHYYHNRKMRTLVATYHRRRREEDRRRQTRYLAPPPYSTLGEDDDKDTELPSYTERDPYNTSLNDSSLDTAVVESASRGDGGSPNEQGLTPHSEAAPQETVASVELEESGETGSASTEQSTSDQAPLLDEGGEQ